MCVSFLIKNSFYLISLKSIKSKFWAKFDLSEFHSIWATHNIIQIESYSLSLSETLFSRTINPSVGWAPSSVILSSRWCQNKLRLFIFARVSSFRHNFDTKQTIILKQKTRIRATRFGKFENLAISEGFWQNFEPSLAKLYTSGQILSKNLAILPHWSV